MINLNLSRFQSKIPVKTFERVLQDNLGITNEQLLVVGDKGYPTSQLLAPVFTSAFSVAANNLGITHSAVYQSTKARGEMADPVLIKQLRLLPDNSCIVVNVSNRLGNMGMLGSSFRKFCAKKGHRFLSTSSLGMLKNNMLQKVIASLDVDAQELQKKGERIKKRIDNASEIQVFTRAGTDLRIGVKTREAIVASGIYKERGTGGNAIPAETYVAPDPTSVEGTLVIDGSIRTTERTRIVREPVVCDVKNGDVVSWNNTYESRLLQDSIRWAHKHAKHPWGIRRIGELGIGLNPKANIIGSTIVDEKTLGTAHLAIGSNAWFGGDVHAIIHLDQVIKDPIFKIDGRLLHL